MTSLPRLALGATLGALFGSLLLLQLAAAAGVSPTTVATLSILWFTAAIGAVGGLGWSK